MCGFVGMVSNNSESLNQLPLEEMMNVIAHRGPDDAGTFGDQHVRLGFRRLSIVDIEKGHQPMCYAEDRYTIIFNGEIYNAPELREQLIDAGLSFQTNSDTEVILAAYHYYGDDCVSKLRGMFSFIIWDKKESRLFGARDPFGIKPLFYRELRDGTIIFASEKKSLFFLNEPTYIEGEAAFHYLTFQYAPEPHTVTANIMKVEPGHSFSWKPYESLRMYTYFTPTFIEKEKNRKWLAPFKRNALKIEKDEMTSSIKNTLIDSVKCHMRSDVPVGAFLSGGIDSSAIVAIAKQFHPNLNTFTAEFDRDGFSEGDVAEETAKALDVNHTRVKISVEDVMKELPKILWQMDEPVADPAAIPLYFVAQEASRHVTVVLSGEGADELFGGYNIYREPQSLKMFKAIPNRLKPSLKKIAEQLPVGMRGRSFIIRGCTPLEDRFVGNAKIFTDVEKEDILIPGSPDWKTSNIVKQLYAEARNANYDDVTTMQYVDIHTWLRGDILVKADKMTMAHSLELRVPFLDPQVFDVASKIPLRGKIQGTQTKLWLREALADIVPNHVLHRKKLGFPVPIRHWLKDEMYDWARSWIQASNTDHLFHKKNCLQLLEDHRLGKIDASRKIWTILTYMIWHHQYIEKKGEDDSSVYNIS
ncbi:asparagine synthase (glutamine-hydrolyzing) [Evansella cellulosilytica]|uniref:asparagine synthase (glutamine-hydrolyzing) n=1 Tax=Evansella cellulosilytica (strain ATCC 21833 / DSM 2522 / FERM P-1141 / JCM 9156 / N-4) TaxID=649639 RepID=E6TS65_EVAC2|nr:asparagine synthase (glutamine-hydrolyzing) [Evansella cellulosilytica]ADU31834.1 asparagine synthase (glutamine-hydrolyzing) [Evansella cellulosilytica DSM 2522]